MDKFLVAVFDNETAAFEGLTALEGLHQQGDITVYATAVLVKDAAGVVTVKKEADEGPMGTALGILIGSMVGVLAGPVGVAAGVTAGYTTGLLLDLGRLGMSSDYMEQVSTTLEPSKVAVLADVNEDWVTPVNTVLAPLGATITRSPKAEFAEDQVNRDAAAFEAELNQLQQELAQANAEDKAMVQKDIEKVRKQLQATNAKIEAQIKQLDSDMKTKLNALNNQMKHANDEKKAQIEKRMTEVKADYAVRNAKLQEARKLALEALKS